MKISKVKSFGATTIDAATLKQLRITYEPNMVDGLILLPGGVIYDVNGTGAAQKYGGTLTLEAHIKATSAATIDSIYDTLSGLFATRGTLTVESVAGTSLTATARCVAASGEYTTVSFTRFHNPITLAWRLISEDFS